MRNPNVRILLIAAALIVVVAAAGILTSGMMKPPAAPAQDGVKAYLRLQVGSEIHPLIPLTDGGEHVVEQGSGRVNVIHTTENSIVMHSSSCENQDCVDQGVVSLENRDSRVLGSLIVCLPNEVILELVSAEEAGGN